MNFILDVGCGDSPEAGANVFVDKYPYGNDERPGPIEEYPKNFVVADVEALPFKDKVFEYCYCSQVLEHTNDPAIAMNELSRVASAGMLDTPHMFGELTIGKPFHKWLVYKRKNMLIFVEKEDREQLPFKRVLYTPIYADNSVKEMAKKAGLLEVVHEWSGRIDYFVVYKDGSTYHDLP